MQSANNRVGIGKNLKGEQIKHIHKESLQKRYLPVDEPFG
jgi:hypothetical protein